MATGAAAGWPDALAERATSAGSSTKVFHSPHDGQRPSHFGDEWPHT